MLLLLLLTAVIMVYLLLLYHAIVTAYHIAITAIVSSANVTTAAFYAPSYNIYNTKSLLLTTVSLILITTLNWVKNLQKIPYNTATTNYTTLGDLKESFTNQPNRKMVK